MEKKEDFITGKMLTLKECEDVLIKEYGGFRVDTSHFDDLDMNNKENKKFIEAFVDVQYQGRRIDNIGYVQLHPFNIFILSKPYYNTVQDFLFFWDCIQEQYNKELIKITPVTKLMNKQRREFYNTCQNKKFLI